jgi:RecA/RadA recombinase
MSIFEKLKKNTTIKTTSILTESKFFEEKDLIHLPVPMMNVAFSGRLDGGMAPGLTMFAGPSKHFKTLFSLICAKAYMEKYPDAALLFYDSEFGTPISYFSSLGIDMERVVHSPITDVEELKFDIVNQIKEIDRNDKLVIVIDSIGNLASKKEVEDAENQKSVSDMSRAKALKSLFRIVTPHLMLKDIPLIAVNHTYKEMSLFPKDIVGGGTGSYYSSDNIFIIGRQQEKDGTDVIGYNFIMRVEKSRYVREKSAIPITVTYDAGMSKWSGLLEVALESGHVIKPKNGWYARVDLETGETTDNMRLKELQSDDFWSPILESKSFQEFIVNKYAVSNNNLLKAD